MSKVLKLVKMIQKEVLPEIEEHMDELFEIVASKSVSEEDKEELKETQSLHKEFKELLEELENGDLEEEEIDELIVELETMRTIDS